MKPGSPLRVPVLALLIAILFAAAACSQTNAQSKNGFDLSGSLIPPSEIYQGGPPRDGIPAIDEPVFVPASNADFLKAEDRVLGLDWQGVRRAYPIRVLNYHEIVNDRVGSDNILISYCPLCGTGVGYRTDSSDAAGFGVSGLLYNSDVLLYDRHSESLWSQILSKAISGPRKGDALQRVALQHTTWGDWRKQYPDTQVLSLDTGHWRDYSRSPYPDYASSESLYFPVSNLDRRYHPKERVMGIEFEGKTRVYPFSELSQAEAPFEDTLAGVTYTVHFDESNGNARVMDSNGNIVPTISGFWFAWMAFHPESEVFEAKR